MTIPAPALAQFTKQVKAIEPDVISEYGDVDGFDRYRSVTFKDSDLAEVLPSAIRAMSDERIQGYTEDGGDLTVTVMATSRADFAHEFEIEAALDVIRDAPKGSAERPYTEADAQAHIDSAHGEPRPRRRAAKKA